MYKFTARTTGTMRKPRAGYKVLFAKCPVLKVDISCHTTTDLIMVLSGSVTALVVMRYKNTQSQHPEAWI